MLLPNFSKVYHTFSHSTSKFLKKSSLIFPEFYKKNKCENFKVSVGKMEKPPYLGRCWFVLSVTTDQLVQGGSIWS